MFGKKILTPHIFVFELSVMFNYLIWKRNMNIDSFDLILFILGVSIGWGISYIFYKRKRQEAPEETSKSEHWHAQMQVSAEEYEKVEHQASLMRRAIENAGIVTFTRNKLREFIGL